MIKTSFILTIAALVIIWILGYYQVIQSYESDLSHYKDSLAFYTIQKDQHYQDSINLVNRSPRNSIKFNSSPIPSAFQNPYLNASQGVEAHLVGLEWTGQWFDSTTIKDLQSKFNARYINSIDMIHLDPDYPKSGYPDLFIQINRAPTLYHLGTVSQSLSSVLKIDRPIETYEMVTTNGSHLKMQLWLVQFDITFRIEPDDDYSSDSPTNFEGRHPITNRRERDLRKLKENNNQRYGDMAVVMEFKPKNGSWYISDSDENDIYNTNSEPIMGIGAVECINIQKIGEGGENNNDKRIGIVLNNGKSLPIHPNLESVKSVLLNEEYQVELPDPEIASRDYLEMKDNQGRPVTLNRDLFGVSKYSFIEIKNLGSWETGKTWIFGEKNYNADSFTASFLIQLYVIGEWVVKPTAFTKFEAREPYQVHKPGLFDKLLPDFHLGLFGKLISGIMIGVILLLLLGFFFPPILLIIKRLISAVHS
ncbi:MAG: hypothetical protein ACFHWX_09530 [Bacteroidota bacterium]